MFVAVAVLVFLGCASGGAQERDLDTGIESGRILYAANCQSCHGGATGGDLRDIPPPHNSNGHTWHHPDQQLLEIVRDGLSFSVENQQKMPAFRDQLTDEEMLRVIAFIKSWWTADQRSYQATVTAEVR